MKVVFSGGVNLTPSSFLLQEELIAYRYNFINLLTTYQKVGKIFKKYGHHLLYADRSAFFVTRKMSKNKKKLMVNKKIFIFSEGLEEFR